MTKRRSAEDSKKFCSNPGSRWYHKMHGEVQPDGTIVLVEDEVIDIQARMNAEYPSTTIDNILANALPTDNFADDGMHGIDALNIPKTLAEFMQFQIDQRNRFDALPVDVKQKFDNDFNKFLATAGEEEWFTKIGIDIFTKDTDGSDGSVSEGE